MEVVIYNRIKTVLQFHNFMNGTGTAIMELKLAQELASVYQDNLFLVFLNLSKMYNNLDQGILLQTIERYEVGQNYGDYWHTFGHDRR